MDASCHTFGGQIKLLRDRMPEPLIEVHIEVDRRESIADGDRGWVEAPQVKGERVRFKVRVTTNLDPGGEMIRTRFTGFEREDYARGRVLH